MMKTILFYTAFWALIAVSFPVALVAFVFYALGFTVQTRTFLHKAARLWAKLVIFMSGSKLTVTGMENIPPDVGVCFVGNHQGDFDTLICLAVFGRPFGFTAKKEAIWLPVVGLWVVLLGGVFIDRKSARKAHAAIVAGAEQVRKGFSMVIFPEGRRSRGEAMGTFKGGAFKLATLADAPVVPFTIDNSYKVWEEHKRIRSTQLGIRFHPAISTAGLDADGKRALPERVRSVIASAQG